MAHFQQKTGKLNTGQVLCFWEIDRHWQKACMHIYIYMNNLSLFSWGTTAFTCIQQTTSFELLINCLHTYNRDRCKYETYTVYKYSVYIYIYTVYIRTCKSTIMTTLPHILHNQSSNQAIKQAIKYSNQLHNIKQLVVSRYPKQRKNYH